MCEISRRGFMVGCSASVAALAGSRFNTLAFAQEPGASEILVVLFLRGGIDGLNLMPPIGGVDRGYYEAARPTLQIPDTGPGAAIQLGSSEFGLHPDAAPLVELYDNNSLAIVQATGLNLANRSHFDAMEFMELGTPGIPTTPTGWLTRHLQSSAEIPEEVIMPTLAMGGLQQASLRGDFEAVNLIDPSIFQLSTGPWRWRPAQRTSLRRLYGFENTPLHTTGTKALDALYTDLDGAGSSNYTQRLTVVAMSEFGRRLEQNTDDGTDHGHGNPMMVMGGNINGGTHGAWPGLAPEQLFEGIDLAVTTDYRTILSEILIRRLANPNLGVIFPGFTDYSPLGVVSGIDLPPNYGTSIFSDGFESGDVSGWSSST